MKIALGLLWLTTWGVAFGQSDPQFQDTNRMRKAAEEFLSTQTNGLPGQINITIGKIDNRLKLPACENLSPFLLPGSKPWGKISLGIRCVAPKPWTIYISANVQTNADYYVTTTPLLQGQLIGVTDIRKVSGDLATLPVGVITNPSQVIGKSLLTSLASGSPLRMDALKTFPVIQQGQSIKVVSSGSGFQVSTEALALNNANEGQVAKAKTISGQLVSGIARTGGVIEISF
jgi:flagella basal body P-ring formation protein FlgA